MAANASARAQRTAILASKLREQGRQAVRAGHPEWMPAIFAEHTCAPTAQAELAQAQAEGLRNPRLPAVLRARPPHLPQGDPAELISAKTGQTVTHLLP